MPMLNKPEHDLARATLRFVRRESTGGKWIWAADAVRAAKEELPTNAYLIRCYNKPKWSFTQTLIDVMNEEFPDIKRCKRGPRQTDLVYFRVIPKD